MHFDFRHDADHKSGGSGRGFSSSWADPHYKDDKKKPPSRDERERKDHNNVSVSAKFFF